MRNRTIYWGVILILMLLCPVPAVHAQGYYNPYEEQQYNRDPYQRDPRNASRGANAYGRDPYGYPQAPAANGRSGHERRDAETILREQVRRNSLRPQPTAPQYQADYQDYYGHRVSGEGQVNQIMAEAEQVAGFITKKNGKSFVVMDKRNFQFYLYDRDGRLLRIGPVAIGKGNTQVGAFETPTGIYPIRSKQPVDDWIRPDWYFIEEGEPIPQKYEDRRVPGFFRFKLVFDGTRYIHYAEATGGRLTHGCLGLDWEDAEAVFHTLDVGSYCIIMDNQLLTRLARGDFPIRKPQAPKAPTGGTEAVTAKAEPAGSVKETPVFDTMW
ncbi:MAG: L,D-transpeptidase [Pseudomonadota bacterium]